MENTIDLDKFFLTHENLIGCVFGRLTVLSFFSWNKKFKQVRWNCVCCCGNEIVALGNNLKRGNTKSCGCLQKERASESNLVHGGRGTRLYGIWKGMNQRCTDSNELNYRYYGGKGICVCNDWHDFGVFRDWAMKNGYMDKLTIDRIDTSKNYSPDNCQWLTRGENTAKGNRQRSNRNEED